MLGVCHTIIMIVKVTIIMMIAMNIMAVRNIVKTIGLAVAVVIIWIVVTVMTLTHINQAGVMVITGVIYLN